MYNLCQSAVKIDNKHSNYFNLEKGVKQGVSLNPMLFNYFINEYMYMIFKTYLDIRVFKINKLSVVL
jgi:hypothetical protein